MVLPVRYNKSHVTSDMEVKNQVLTNVYHSGFNFFLLIFSLIFFNYLCEGKLILLLTYFQILIYNVFSNIDIVFSNIEVRSLRIESFAIINLHGVSTKLN